MARPPAFDSRRRRPLPLALVAIGLALAGVAGASAARQPGTPQLLVVVVVDQMRADYLTRFDRFWTAGFRRLLTEGAVFENAAYPYSHTVTCAGHATIATGTLPSKHGVVLNEWWQRAANRRMSCTNDPAATSVPYGGGAPEPIGHSAHRLRMPTLADRLRETSPRSQVVVLSLKARSAAMLAGQGGLVTWFADTNTWATSSAYAAAPVPDVAATVAAQALDDQRALVWERMLAPQRYGGMDHAAGERPKPGWTSVFPHPIAGAPGTSVDESVELWKRSPFSDAALGAMAADLVRRLKLGQRGVVDFLGVSFSAVDYIGHDFGPDSHELQDALVRLDQTLGRLMEALDAHVGRRRYVLAFSADHGVSPIPEQYRAEGRDAGRVLSVEVRKVAEAAMVAAHGPGPHIAHVESADIYLTEAARRMVSASPGALQPLLEAVATVPGVARVLPATGLADRRDSTDPAERAVALSYFPGESGDAILVLKPYWIGSTTSAATHGTHHHYDQRVPVIFMGGGLRPGRYLDAATPADVAPTLGSIVDVTLPAPDGRALSGALR